MCIRDRALTVYQRPKSSVSFRFQKKEFPSAFVKYSPHTYSCTRGCQKSPSLRKNIGRARERKIAKIRVQPYFCCKLPNKARKAPSLQVRRSWLLCLRAILLPFFSRKQLSFVRRGCHTLRPLRPPPTAIKTPAREFDISPTDAKTRSRVPKIQKLEINYSYPATLILRTFDWQ